MHIDAAVPPVGFEADAFNEADVDSDIPGHALASVARLALSWAKADAGLNRLLCEMLHLPYDFGEIMIRRMGIVDKQQRITEMYAHVQNIEAKNASASAAKLIETNYKIRNTVCHCECLGSSRLVHPNSLIFILSHKIKGLPGNFRVQYIPIETIEESTNFAEQLYASMAPLSDAWRQIRADYINRN